MIVFTIIVIIILADCLIGSVVLALLDTEDQCFYKWYASDPTGVSEFFILLLWPILAVLMVRYKLGK